MSDADIVEIAERDGFLFAAITDTWGPRCPSFEPSCWCCKAWAEYDRVTRLRALNAELVEASRKWLDAVNDKRAFEHHQPHNIGKEWERLRMLCDIAEDGLRAAIAKAEREGA